MTDPTAAAERLRRTVSEAAILVLLETDNRAVMAGDEGLLHLIADKMGWQHEAWKTSDRVLAALRKTPGRLIVSKTYNGRASCNLYSLPTHLRALSQEPQS